MKLKRALKEALEEHLDAIIETVASKMRKKTVAKRPQVAKKTKSIVSAPRGIDKDPKPVIVNREKGNTKRTEAEGKKPSKVARKRSQKGDNLFVSE
jgi:hypothetical protein